MLETHRVKTLSVGSANLFSASVVSRVSTHVRLMGDSTLTPSSGLTKNTGKAPGQGSVTPASDLPRQTSKIFLSNITPAGSPSQGRLFQIAVNGTSYTFPYNFTFNFSPGSGEITIYSTLGKKTYKSASRIVTPSSAVNKTTSKYPGQGTSTPTSTLGTARTKLQAVGSAVLTATSTLPRLVGKLLDSTLTPGSVVNKSTTRGVGGGTATPAGTVNKMAGKFTGLGSVTPGSVISRVVSKFPGGGNVTSGGTISRMVSKFPGQGSVASVGVFTYSGRLSIITSSIRSGLSILSTFRTSLRTAATERDNLTIKSNIRSR